MIKTVLIQLNREQYTFKYILNLIDRAKITKSNHILNLWMKNKLPTLWDAFNHNFYKNCWTHFTNHHVLRPIMHFINLRGHKINMLTFNMLHSKSCSGYQHLRIVFTFMFYWHWSAFIVFETTFDILTEKELFY